MIRTGQSLEQAIRETIGELETAAGFRFPYYEITFHPSAKDAIPTAVYDIEGLIIRFSEDVEVFPNMDGTSYGEVYIRPIYTKGEAA